MVPPSSVKITRVPTYLMRQSVNFVYGAITLYRWTFQTIPLSTNCSACPLSLAATEGISFDFFSSGYLDVSVPRVCFLHLCIQCKIPNKLGGFPHSDIVGSMLVYQLPHTFRRLLRPSSPPVAKASAMCAYSLDHITQVTIGSTYSRCCFLIPAFTGTIGYAASITDSLIQCRFITIIPLRIILIRFHLL
jgi:hypothetical protein